MNTRDMQNLTEERHGRIDSGRKRWRQRSADKMGD